MKNFLALVISFVIAASVMAQTKFPKGTFEMADLDKAKATATSEKKQIAFIYTSKTTTCGLCQGATAAYIEAVKSKTVIVYVDSDATKQWWPKLPEPVRQGLTPGKFIPKIVVTDPAASKVATSLNYEDYKKDERKAIRGLKAGLKAE